MQLMNHKEQDLHTVQRSQKNEGYDSSAPAFSEVLGGGQAPRYLTSQRRATPRSTQCSGAWATLRSTEAM